MEDTSQESTVQRADQTFVDEVIQDYRICVMSREASLLARKEVLSGKAKFGIIGDGKEVPQVAMARAFKKGDYRSGYYRDQTFMFALGLSTLGEFFAQLYADTERDPFSGGRQMNCHFATAMIDQDGQWLDHTDRYNVTADISPTGGQMARALGISQASKWYRAHQGAESSNFSNQGNEVCFVTIGDASTSEGVFWETVNAACVMQVPMAISVWDDGYGISVPKEFQTTKGSISKLMEGFRYEEELRSGMHLYRVYGWDYPSLCEVYEQGIDKVRREHVPALFHVEEVTQPQGHSTSGSHERYKSAERLEWEQQHDCNRVMRQWMIESQIATEEQLSELEAAVKQEVKDAKNAAWKAYQAPVKEAITAAQSFFEKLSVPDQYITIIQEAQQELKSLYNPVLSEVISIVRKARLQLLNVLPDSDTLSDMQEWLSNHFDAAKMHYHTHLYSETDQSAIHIQIEPAHYSDDAPMMNGYEILNTCFDKALARMDHLIAFGEDVGAIGDVNQGFAGLQDKYGQHRVTDTGIREWTIMGQAIGLAMRGLRPIAEVQYLDYLVYGLSALTDDLATLRYRSDGIQKAPAIIRTRGHRLEGIWHTGSPMSMILGSLRGMYVLVPRNMTQAAGFYNTLLQSDDPALVVECLNGYRYKEKMPDNIGTFTVPLGVPEVLRSGSDLTLITYGSCVRIAEKACVMLEQVGIDAELIDVQTLLPFDLEHRILHSLRKTNRIVFLDEDVPGGATAYMMQKVLEEQGGYQWLDAAPATVTASAHRSPFGSEGDYFSKPQVEDVFEAAYQLMRESMPQHYTALR